MERRCASAISRTVEQGAKIRLGRIGKAIHRADGKIIDNDDVVEGIVLLRKGAYAEPTLKAIHEKVKELNDHILPPGVKMVPFLDRSDLLHYTTHTVLHNLTEGFILVAIVLFLFLGKPRSALIVALTIPFALLFASICLDLRKIPANLLSLGALDFGMVVDGAVVMVENIVRHMSRSEDAVEIDSDEDSQGRARSAAAGLLCHHNHHHRVSAHLHTAASGRAALPAHGLDGRLRACSARWRFPCSSRPCWPASCSAGRSASGKIRCLVWITRGYRRAVDLDGTASLGDGRRAAVAAVCCSFYLLTSGVIGSEFLPHLDEGAIWVRGTARSQHRPHRRRRAHEPGAHRLCFLP